MAIIQIDAEVPKVVKTEDVVYGPFEEYRYRSYTVEFPDGRQETYSVDDEEMEDGSLFGWVAIWLYEHEVKEEK